MIAKKTYTKPRPQNAVLSAGHIVGRYKINKKLSSGGFGVVYLAERNDGKQVALKEFLPSVIPCRKIEDDGQIYCGDKSDAARFEKGLKAFFREADMLAQVHNSRIIPIWDVFKANGTAYFAMPVERGGTLHAYMKTRDVSEFDLVNIFIDACKGVEVLHSKGLLHLDIKPSNLWLRPDNSVLILDLGASRWEDEEMKNVQMARTPGFAAIEQHEDKRSNERVGNNLSVKTDVYALCASMLSCLTGEPPKAANKRTAGDQPITTELLGFFSQDLLKIINKGMSIQPEMRYKDVTELRKDLEKIPRLHKSNFWFENINSNNWFIPDKDLFD